MNNFSVPWDPQSVYTPGPVSASVPKESARSGGAGLPPRLHRRVLAAADAVGDFIEAWGFKSIHGRVWALLAMRGTPIAQTELAETLGVSRSLISLAIAELLEYGLVKARSDRRNAPYEACMEVWPTISDVLRNRESILMERAKLALEAALVEAEAVAETVADPPPVDPERIRLLLDMTEFAQTVLRTILRIRIPRSLDVFALWLKKANRRFHRLGRGLPSMFS